MLSTIVDHNNQRSFHYDSRDTTLNSVSPRLVSDAKPRRYQTNKTNSHMIKEQDETIGDYDDEYNNRYNNSFEKEEEEEGKH